MQYHRFSLIMSSKGQVFIFSNVNIFSSVNVCPEQNIEVTLSHSLDCFWSNI